MLDHIGISAPSTKFSQIVSWYSAALAPLGYKLQEFIPGQLVGLGAEDNYKHNKYDIWIHKKNDGEEQPPIHFAFRAKSRKEVDAFHEEAIKAGGKDNGKPGLRPQYHENYYGAFVLDPCG